MVRLQAEYIYGSLRTSAVSNMYTQSNSCVKLAQDGWAYESALNKEHA
jgi:hypothetical protein